MSLLSNIQAEITAIETYLLSYLPVDHHDQIRRAVAVAHANVDAHAQAADAAESEALYGGVAPDAGVPDSATLAEGVGDDPPVQGELNIGTAAAQNPS